MVRYHISADGNANVCKAEPGNCPLKDLDGNMVPHFYDKESAQAYFEDHMKEAEISSASKSSKKDLDEHNGEITYRMRSFFEPDARKMIEKANRRLERAGIEERFEFTEKLSYLKRRLPNGMTVADEYVSITLNRPSISYNGYNFLAAINKEEKGFITRTPAGVELNGWKPEAQVCEHCGIKRPRMKTYLVEGPDGTRKQIGSSCLKAYMGLKPEGLWALSVDPLEKIGSEDDLPSFSSDRKASRPVKEMIALALAVSDNGKHFVPRSSYEKPTSDLVEEAIWGGYKVDKQWQDEVNAKYKEYIENGRVDELIQKVQNLPDGNDYVANLKTVTSGEWVTPKSMGLLVSILSLEKREKKKKEEKIAFTKGFAAAEGEKIKGMKATVVSNTEIESTDYYGAPMTKSRIIMQDSDGHQMIWWASNKIDEVQDGDEVVFKSGSVKANKQYREVDQTVLTRVKFASVLQGEKEDSENEK